MPSISARIPDDERETLEEVADLLDEDRVRRSGRRFGRVCTTSAFESPSSAIKPVKYR